MHFTPLALWDVADVVLLPMLMLGPPFMLARKRYFAQYEFSASHIMCSSDCEQMTVAELLEMAGACVRACMCACVCVRLCLAADGRCLRWPDPCSTVVLRLCTASTWLYMCLAGADA